MTSPVRTSRRRLQGRIGAVLIAGSTALGLLAVPSTTAAQEEPEPQTLTVTAEALFVRSAGNAAPDTVTSEFPPGAVCLVTYRRELQEAGLPQLCGEETSPVTDPVTGVLHGDLDGDGEQDAPPPEQTPDDQSPQQPVAPDTYTVAQSGGEDRYASALKFELPEIPEGKQVVSGALVLHQTQPSYHTSSPAFRQAMLAVLAGVRDQQQAAEEMTKIVTQADRYPAVEEDLGEVGAEICPFTEPFEEGSQEWSQTPAFDCIFGANGIRDDGDGTWTFDLTFALQAWQDGTLANHGVYLRETAAPNLAFGDPDTSWMTQVSWGSADSDGPPQIVLELEDIPEGGGTYTFDPGTGSASSGTSTGSTGLGSSPGGSTNTFAAPPSFTSESGTASTATEPSPQVAPETTGGAGTQDVASGQVPAGSTTDSGAWWVWLLAPVLAAGTWMVSRSLTAEAVAATGRAGAMTRLIEQRRGDGRGPPGISFQV